MMGFLSLCCPGVLGALDLAQKPVQARTELELQRRRRAPNERSFDAFSLPFAPFASCWRSSLAWEEAAASAAWAWASPFFEQGPEALGAAPQLRLQDLPQLSELPLIPQTEASELQLVAPLPPLPFLPPLLPGLLRPLLVAGLLVAGPLASKLRRLQSLERLEEAALEALGALEGQHAARGHGRSGWGDAGGASGAGAACALCQVSARSPRRLQLRHDGACVLPGDALEK